MDDPLDMFKDSYMSAFRSDGTKGKQYKVLDIFNHDYLRMMGSQILGMCEPKRDDTEENNG